jgi:hypothetical protein
LDAILPVVSNMSDKNRHQEIKIRRQLEGSLRERFHETFWEELQQYVHEHLDEELEFPALRDLAEEKLEVQRKHEREVLEKRGLLEEQPPDGSEDYSGHSGHSDVREVSPVFSIELPKREQKRADVLLEIQMRQAAKHPDVEDFRDRGLGGRLLFAEEAEAYFRPGTRGSITDEGLADLAQRLRKYYGWHPHDAAWFVLTGDAPTLEPLAASFHHSVSVYGPNYGEITLHAAPWVPADEVKRAFLEARDRMRAGAGPGTVSKQRLEVLRFVEEERAKRQQQTPLTTLFEAWNQREPHWAYADYTAFSKAYREARKEVLYPDYRLPDRESTPNIERQQARIHEWTAAIRELLKKRNQDQ